VPGISDSLLKSLYFGKDDAESDIAAGGLLRDGLLKTAAYNNAMSGRKTLIIGRKGSGKSAICVGLREAPPQGLTVSVVTPDEISADEIRRFELQGITPEQSKALMWRYLFATEVAKCIIRHVATAHDKQSQAVKQLRRFLADNGEHCEIGFNQKFWRIIERLKSSISLNAFGGSVRVELAPSEGIRVNNTLDVLEANIVDAQKAIGCTCPYGTHLMLVDQIERVWSNDARSDAMVTGLLLASKDIATKFTGLRCVVLLRTDIYDMLLFQDRDKFRGDEFRIDWNESDLLDLVLIRARVSMGVSLEADELWGTVFPASIEGTPIQKYLVGRTLMRPREMIQLCNACRDTAEKNGNGTIEESDVIEAVTQYSNWKFQDLLSEYRINYPFLVDLFILFQNSSYLLPRKELGRRLDALADSLATRYPETKSVFNLGDVIDILWGIGFLGVVRHGVNEYSYSAPVSIREDEYMLVIQPGFREALRSTSSVVVRPYEPGRIKSRYASGLSQNAKLRTHSASRVLKTAQHMMQNLEERINKSSLPEEVDWELRQTLHRMWCDIGISLDELGNEEAFYSVAQDMASTFRGIASRLQAWAGVAQCGTTDRSLEIAFYEAAETLRSPRVLREQTSK
jgi:hypothetical protein